MFKFVQCLLVLTSADGAHKPAVRDDATYRSVFPSKSAYPQEVSHFDSPMSVDDMKEGVTAHDEGKKEDDFSLVTTKEDEEGLRDASAATTAPETASTTVGIALSGDINGPEMVGNPSQFFSLSEVVLEGKGACPTDGKPYCVFSTKWTTGAIRCKCVQLTDTFIQFKKQNGGEKNFVACEKQRQHSGEDECGWDHKSVRESGSRDTVMIGDKSGKRALTKGGAQAESTGNLWGNRTSATPQSVSHSSFDARPHGGGSTQAAGNPTGGATSIHAESEGSTLGKGQGGNMSTTSRDSYQNPGDLEEESSHRRHRTHRMPLSHAVAQGMPAAGGRERSAPLTQLGFGPRSTGISTNQASYDNKTDLAKQARTSGKTYGKATTRNGSARALIRPQGPTSTGRTEAQAANLMAGSTKPHQAANRAAAETRAKARGSRPW